LPVVFSKMTCLNVAPNVTECKLLAARRSVNDEELMYIDDLERRHVSVHII